MTNLASGPSVSLRRRRGPPTIDSRRAPSVVANQRTSTSPTASASSCRGTTTSTSSSFGWKGITEQDVSDKATKNVVVLGGSYGGMHAASVLAMRLPPSHRVILIERNSHFNHLYVFPRFSVLPGHEHKAFVPYTSIFKDAPARPKLGSARSRAVHRDGGEPGTEEGTNKSRTTTRGVLADRGTTDFDRSSPNSASKSEDLIGMGSLSGPTKEGQARTSRGGDGFSIRTRRSDSPSTSSSSLTFSTDDSPLHNAASHESLTSAGGSIHGGLQREKESIPDPAAVAGNREVERAIAEAGEAALSEEKFGRPSMVVEDLADVLEQGMDLEGKSSSSDSQGSQATDEVEPGFEDAHPHIVLQACATRITDSHVVVEPSVRRSSTSSKPSKLWSIDSVSIPYTHLIYAMGSHLPDPLRTEARTKSDGTAWMRAIQRRIASSGEIVIVGGGALGVQYATDIKSLHREKEVTLIHSRKQLLPNFDPRVHEHAMGRLEELGVRVVLGERLALAEGCPRGSSVQPSNSNVASTSIPPPPPSAPLPTMTQGSSNDATTLAPGGSFCKPGDGLGQGAQAAQEGVCLGDGRKKIRTTAGKEFECDLLLLCTGQQPNSALMAQLSPTSVDPSTRLVRVLPTLQVALPDPKEVAQMPFDAKPPCGDCDCFLDKKAAGASLSREQAEHLGNHGLDIADDEDQAESIVTARPGRLHNVYAIGDVADAFGALNAGYQAWAMADVAAENVLRDIGASINVDGEGEGEKSDGKRTSGKIRTSSIRNQAAEMMHFVPAPNYLKLSLGLGRMVYQGAKEVEVEVDVDVEAAGEGQGHESKSKGEAKKGEKKRGREEERRKVMQATVEDKEDPEDLAVEGVWTFMAKASTEDMHL